jgi:hypothetical protein
MKLAGNRVLGKATHQAADAPSNFPLEAVMMNFLSLGKTTWRSNSRVTAAMQAE